MAAKAVYLSARGIVTELVKSPVTGDMSVDEGIIVGSWFFLPAWRRWQATCVAIW